MADRSNTRIGIRHMWFDMCWSSYLMVKCLQWGGMELPVFFTSYFSDLLCMPIVFGMSGELMRKLWGADKAWLSPAKLIGGLVYFSLFFEWLWPSWNSQATGDPLDVLCYSIGTIFFWYMQGVYSHVSSSTTVL